MKKLERCCHVESGFRTSKCSCHEHRRKATNSPDKGRIADEPVVAAYVMMRSVSSAIDHNPEEYENLVQIISKVNSRGLMPQLTMIVMTFNKLSQYSS